MTNSRRGDGDRDAPRHPIGVVAERTGLTPDVLRVWQKRYDVVAPGRSERGRRLYSDAEVERLVLLSNAVRGGRSISAVAGLPDDELLALVAGDEQARRALAEVRGDATTAVIDAALSATAALDAGELAAVLRRGLVLLSVPRFIDEVATPLLHEIGERWARGELTPAHEHLASAAMRRLLEWVMSACEADPDAPHIVLTTLPHEQHELGALLAATTAASEGWSVTYLGPNLPVGDTASAVRQSSASHVGVSIVYDGDDVQQVRALSELRASLPSGVHLLVGGRSAASAARGLSGRVRVMQDASDFRRLLRAALPS
jgi:DNA-binding transcriptional MerR regulator/methylmalonyl-CoA mutase cobalamin-binding subunit